MRRGEAAPRMLPELLIPAEVASTPNRTYRVKFDITALLAKCGASGSPSAMSGPHPPNGGKRKRAAPRCPRGASLLNKRFLPPGSDLKRDKDRPDGPSKCGSTEAVLSGPDFDQPTHSGEKEAEAEKGGMSQTFRQLFPANTPLAPTTRLTSPLSSPPSDLPSPAPLDDFLSQLPNPSLEKMDSSLETGVGPTGNWKAATPTFTQSSSRNLAQNSSTSRSQRFIDSDDSDDGGEEPDIDAGRPVPQLELRPEVVDYNCAPTLREDSWFCSGEDTGAPRYRFRPVIPSALAHLDLYNLAEGGVFWRDLVPYNVSRNLHDNFGKFFDRLLDLERLQTDTLDHERTRTLRAVMRSRPDNGKPGDRPRASSSWGSNPPPCREDKVLSSGPEDDRKSEETGSKSTTRSPLKTQGSARQSSGGMGSSNEARMKTSPDKSTAPPSHVISRLSAKKSLESDSGSAHSTGGSQDRNNALYRGWRTRFCRRNSEVGTSSSKGSSASGPELERGPPDASGGSRATSGHVKSRVSRNSGLSSRTTKFRRSPNLHGAEAKHHSPKTSPGTASSGTLVALPKTSPKLSPGERSKAAHKMASRTSSANARDSTETISSSDPTQIGSCSPPQTSTSAGNLGQAMSPVPPWPKSRGKSRDFSANHVTSLRKDSRLTPAATRTSFSYRTSLYQSDSKGMVHGRGKRPQSQAAAEYRIFPALNPPLTDGVSSDVTKAKVKATCSKSHSDGSREDSDSALGEEGSIKYFSSATSLQSLATPPSCIGRTHGEKGLKRGVVLTAKSAQGGSGHLKGDNCKDTNASASGVEMGELSQRTSSVPSMWVTSENDVIPTRKMPSDVPTWVNPSQLKSMMWAWQGAAEKSRGSVSRDSTSLTRARTVPNDLQHLPSYPRSREARGRGRSKQVDHSTQLRSSSNGNGSSRTSGRSRGSQDTSGRENLNMSSHVTGSLHSSAPLAGFLDLAASRKARGKKMADCYLGRRDGGRRRGGAVSGAVPKRPSRQPRAAKIYGVSACPSVRPNNISSRNMVRKLLYHPGHGTPVRRNGRRRSALPKQSVNVNLGGGGGGGGGWRQGRRRGRGPVDNDEAEGGLRPGFTKSNSSNNASKSSLASPSSGNSSDSSASPRRRHVRRRRRRRKTTSLSPHKVELRLLRSIANRQYAKHERVNPSVKEDNSSSSVKTHRRSTKQHSGKRRSRKKRLPHST